MGKGLLSVARGVFYAMTFIGVLATSALIGYALFHEEEPGPTYAEECVAYTIIWTGLRSCMNDRVCQLGDEEMMRMYVSGKRSTIACASSNMVQMFQDRDKLNDPEPEVAEPEVEVEGPDTSQDLKADNGPT